MCPHFASSMASWMTSEEGVLKFRYSYTMYSISVNVPASGKEQLCGHHFPNHWRTGPKLSRVETLLCVKCPWLKNMCNLMVLHVYQHGMCMVSDKCCLWDSISANKPASCLMFLMPEGIEATCIILKVLVIGPFLMWSVFFSLSEMLPISVSFWEILTQTHALFSDHTVFFLVSCKRNLSWLSTSSQVWGLKNIFP